MIAANVRSTRARLSGIQRYTLELLKHLAARVECIEPRLPLGGVRGHAWEQLVLPIRLGDRLLWSPGNTGPLVVEKQVLTLHDLSALDRPDTLAPRFSAWYAWLLPRLVHRVRHVIVDSCFTRSRLLAHTQLEPERIAVIPIGVGSRFRPRSEGEIEGTREQLGLPTRHYVLSLGSLEPRKNLPQLLRAWDRIHERVDDEVWLVVAGASGPRHVFRDARLGPLPPRVHRTGHVSEQLVPALYSGALAFVYLSEYEGFGLPPLEAMASGVPVVSSNRTSLPEVVGDAALLVDPGNLEAVAAGLLRIIEDAALREKLAVKSIARAQGFSWERTAAQTWRVLRDSAG